MDEQTLERIEDYLFGRMSSRERADFEREMEEDDRLREWYRLVRISYDASERDIEHDLRMELDQIRKRQERKKQGIYRFVPRLRTIAAVMVPLLFVGAYLYWAGQYGDDDLFRQYYNPYTVETMRSGEDNRDELAKASNKFHGGKYREALQLLASIESTDSLYNRALLIEAAVLEGMGRTDEAMGRLRELRDRTDDILSDQADWQLLLLHLKQSDREQYKRLLDQIIKREEHIYRARARQLKKEVDVPFRNVW